MRLKKNPSMTEIKRTPYMMMMLPIWKIGYGTKVKIRTIKMMGRKYSPIDLREST